MIELASRIADWGTFIVPQTSAPFRYSGRQTYSVEIDKECQKFIEQTGIELGMNCGIDTSTYLDEWKGVSPMCEIVICEFGKDEELEAAVPVIAESQLSLFDAA